jgi:hypothetical protein
VQRLSEVLGHHVQFASTAWDRIVLNGYLERLQRAENIVYFFRAVVGVPRVTPEVLLSRTAPYRAGVARYAAEQGIPIVPAPKGVRKEEVVAPYYRQFKGAEGGACVLSSVEQGRTCVSYTPRYPPSGGDPDYRLIRACRKRFLHYYFYVVDPVLGPMSLRVGTFLPFTLAYFLNGHSFLAQELTRQGIGFRKEDNAFLAVADEAALAAASTRFTPRLIEHRGDHWAGRRAPAFSAAERAVLPLRYRDSIAQLELATDVLCKRAAPLRALFRRATELGVLLGGADRTTYLFGRRLTHRSGGRLETVLDRRNEGQPILRSYDQSSFVKPYEKGDRLLRTETCLNDTHHLGIGRRLEHLPDLRERLLTTNTRYLETQAELLASTVDAGDLTRLGRPVLVGQRRVPGLKLEDDRVIRVLEALLHPGPFVADWTSRAVHARLLARHRVTEANYRLGQLRYDLSKLRAHGLVERIGTSRRYRLTARGLKLGVLLVKLRTRLLGPLVSLATANDPATRRATRHPSAVEAAFHQLDAALTHLCDTLGLRSAA